MAIALGVALAVIMAMVVAMVRAVAVDDQECDTYIINGCSTNHMQGSCRCSELTWWSWLSITVKLFLNSWWLHICDTRVQILACVRLYNAVFANVILGAVKSCHSNRSHGYNHNHTTIAVIAVVFIAVTIATETVTAMSIVTA